MHWLSPLVGASAFPGIMDPGIISNEEIGIREAKWEKAADGPPQGTGIWGTPRPHPQHSPGDG